MNALEMVIIELVKLLLFSAVWYLIARFFYPHYSKKVALDIMDDEEYVKKTQSIQETWMHAMVTRETDRLFDLVRAEIGDANVDPDQIVRELREYIPNCLNSWYGNLIKKDNAVQQEQDGSTREMMEYASMNKDNPDALSMIKDLAVRRNPNLAPLIMLVDMFKGNGSRSPPQGGGGY
jgi:hypothetical protein